MEVTRLPLIVSPTRGPKVVITESDLRDYPGMWLRGTGGLTLTRVSPKRPSIVGAKSGLVARADHGLFSRGAKLSTYRKIDLELLIYAYFIGSLALWESALPTSLEAVDRGSPTAARS